VAGDDHRTGSERVEGVPEDLRILLDTRRVTRIGFAVSRQVNGQN
jgi:hypothetical protein